MMTALQAGFDIDGTIKQFGPNFKSVPIGFRSTIGRASGLAS
jgi:hypothetical protein